MGLAATQARFLTITSRLSNNEFRQQGLAMMKMRLASDQEKVATKYSEALNNQTLQADGKNITMEALERMGYDVIRTSDREKATKASSVTTTTYGMEEPQAPAKPLSIVGKPLEPGNKNDVLRDGATGHITDVRAQIEEYKNTLESITEEELNEFNNGGQTTVDDGVEVSDINAYKNEIASKAQIVVDKMNEIESLKNSTNGLSESIASVESTNIPETNIGLQDIKSVINALEDLDTRLDEASEAIVTYYNGLPPELDKTQAQYDQEDAEFQANQAEWKAYDDRYSQYQKDYKDYLASAVTTTETVAENELYTNCKNEQFLIQGLLSGYLSLVKDEKVVSLDANTDILTEYDKTDDARAEAEYESEMKKINMKEKAIDNQMRRLDTEYSALKTELQSVQSILSQHTSNDFQLFS